MLRHCGEQTSASRWAPARRCEFPVGQLQTLQSNTLEVSKQGCGILSLHCAGFPASASSRWHRLNSQW